MREEPGVSAPLPFVVEVLADLPPGRALDLACGKGRHLRLLQAAGWKSLGIDRDKDALATATKIAPGCETILFDLEQGDLEQGDLEQGGLPDAIGSFDLVLTTFFLFRPLLPAAFACLRPGGHFLLETFHAENRTRRGHPRRKALALEPGEARSLVERAGLIVVREDEGERGAVFSTRLLARVGQS